MKIRLLSIALWLLALLSCNDEENKVEYNFSVLGIEKIIVGEEVLNVDSSGFPITDKELFAITGFSDLNSTKTYNLAILSDKPDKENITVKSKYNDTSAKIEKDVDSGFYNIIVSRAGFNEKIIYIIGFIITDK